VWAGEISLKISGKFLEVSKLPRPNARVGNFRALPTPGALSGGIRPNQNQLRLSRMVHKKAPPELEMLRAWL
jgi:hypothetical protein